MINQELQLNINRSKRNVALGLITAIVAVNVIVFATGEGEFGAWTRDISRILTAGGAAAFSLIIVKRQGTNGLFGRSFLALAAGLALWVAAEITWGYYELGLQIENPFPSPADALWLAGYGPLGYYMFSQSKFYANGVGKAKTILVSIVAALFCLVYIQNIVAIFGLPTEETNIMFAISLAYPTLDALILIPALLVIMNSGKGMLTSVPWIFMFGVFTVIADGLLGFAAVQNFNADLFIINLFYTMAYLSALAGMYWHNRFMIFDKKQAAKYYSQKE